MWGANAVNGVINILTKPARESQGSIERNRGAWLLGSMELFHMLSEQDPGVKVVVRTISVRSTMAVG